MTCIDRRHAPSVLRRLLRLTNGDRPAAEDMLQETMLRAWRHVEKLPAHEPEQRRRAAEGSPAHRDRLGPGRATDAPPNRRSSTSTESSWSNNAAAPRQASYSARRRTTDVIAHAPR
ncbi:sigma factor [Actinoplanes sp. NPDC049265]|uniref:sigma factor n=1 Tax=Actinoplanes sp. NPDC049265 TaxID=3363902 RepID=UPI00372316CD